MHHEKHYCTKSPHVEDAWRDSGLNPENRCCATCANSESFLTKYGCYEEGPSVSECPQRLDGESDRVFPCSAYARCRHIPAVNYDTREFTEIALRYYRSFGLPTE